MSTPISIAIHGAGGRMGRAILRLAQVEEDLVVAAALVREGSALQGRAIAQAATAHESSPRASTSDYTVALASAIEPDVLIDFSTAQAFDAALRIAIERRCAFVSGTTGIDARQRIALDAAAMKIPVLWSANFSLGVALLSRLVAEAASALPDWDCEIAEAHHAGKRDAPSGTALALGRDVAAVRGLDFERVAVLPRNVPESPRGTQSIGFAVTRAGDIVGEHTVTFATHGERIELTHRATDRDIFARGALVAARWIAGRAPGIYSMADVARV